ncbi:MAG: hypothetical protein KDA92_21960 [Planctomycetales bacterium]|nr:hypothetical protein [Planctomycetales bacterium]
MNSRSLDNLPRPNAGLTEAKQSRSHSDRQATDVRPAYILPNRDGRILDNANKRSARANPFYVLLVVVGTAFVLTACAYGVMAVKQLHASQASWSRDTPRDTPAADARFIAFMDTHGVKLMLVEVGVLAVASALAMGTDSWWTDEKQKPTS